MKLNYLKMGLSLLIAYHLIVICMVPNESSYLTRKLKPILLPYSNTMGLTRVWQFFAPEPGPSVVMEYTAMKDGTKLATDFFPPLHNPYFFRDHYNRRIASLRVAAKIPGYMQAVVIPYLCRQHPGATVINYSIWVGGAASLADVENGSIMNDTSRREVTSTDLAFCDGKSVAE